jgi:hypothetical protein
VGLTANAPVVSPRIADASIRCMTLVLEVVAESLFPRRERVFPDFEKDARFNQTWWHSGSAKSPVTYCRLLDNGEEVGRAKILPGSRSYSGYTTWACPPAGVTEIDLIEIRSDLRRSNKRYGRQAVEAIRRTYGQPVIAMSLDGTSDTFWRALGWTAHTHPDGDRYRILFTSA